MLITDFSKIIKKRGEPSWINEKRLDMFMKFSQLPMPNPKEEEWRYTDISKINLDTIKLDKDVGIETEENNEIVVLSMKEALAQFSDVIKKYAFSLSSVDKFTTFVLSFWDNGIFIYVPKNVKIENSIHYKIVNSGKPSYSLIILDENSKLNLIEENISNIDNETISTNVTEIFVNDDSKLNFYTYQELPEKFYNFYHKVATVKRNSEINWFIGSFGSQLSRWKVETFMEGENSQCHKYGIVIGNRNQHHDIITKTFHLVPYTTNEIQFKSVTTDQSSYIYRGLIRIEKQAQQTSSYMGAHTLLLSDKAKANNIPSLEIEANDVKATHGSSVGQIDEEKLFYLMTRGLNKEEAEWVIVEGFVESILNKFELEDVKEKFKNLVNKRLWKNV